MEQTSAIGQTQTSDKKAILVILLTVLATFVALAALIAYIYKNYKNLYPLEENTSMNSSNFVTKFMEFLETGDFEYHYSSSDTIEPQDTNMEKTNTTTNTSVFQNSSQPQAQTEKTNSAPPCFKYNILIPEFKSNKCYIYEDLTKLSTALYSYNVAKQQLVSAEKSIEIFCENSKTDLGKEICNEHKEEKEDLEDQLFNLTSEVNLLLQKGR